MRVGSVRRCPETPSMPDTDSITLVKRFTYRDLPEEWSNTYHLDGVTPVNDAEWRALAIAIHNSEKQCYTADHVLVAAYGYEAGNETSVYQGDFTVGSSALAPGTLTVVANSTRMAGDQAAWIRARVGLSSTGKKVYVRKYFHGGTVQTGDPDETQTNWRDNAAAHAAAMLAGGLPGGMKWVGPQGATPIEPQVSRYVTTRTLKRRGKRPTSP
jgi:hypothetical protein